VPAAAGPGPASAASAQTPRTAAQRAPETARVFLPAFILFATLTGLADGLALKELRYAAIMLAIRPNDLGPPNSAPISEQRLSEVRHVSKR
jgi:hypothetical protein